MGGDGESAVCGRRLNASDGEVTDLGGDSPATMDGLGIVIAPKTRVSPAIVNTDGDQSSFFLKIDTTQYNPTAKIKQQLLLCIYYTRN